MKVLITGAAGFIGSHLAERMVAEGNEVHAIDDLSNGRSDFVPRGCRAVLYSSVADPATLRYISQSNFNVVYHLAAMPRVSYSVEHPRATNEANLNTTVALLEACRGNVGRFVFTSSSSVYGDASVRPTPESSPPDPKSPYALQKLVGEKYCEMFSDLYNMDTVSLRPFNVFGPRQLAHGPYSTVVSAWLHAIKHGGQLRSDGDGSQTRDMTHVSNVVDVFARLASYPPTLSGQVFNAGCGVSVSNNQIMAWLLARHPEARDRVVNAPWRVGDVRATQASTASIVNHLGFKTVTTFWDGLQQTYDWAMSSDIF